MPSSAGSQLGHPRRSSNSLVACRCARGLSSSLLFNTMLPTRPKEGRAKKNHWAMLGNQIFCICHVCVGMITNCFCWSITCRQIKTPKMTQMRLQFHSLFCKQTFYSNEGGISVWGRAERRQAALPSIMPSSRSRWQACCQPSVKPCCWCFLSPSCRPSASPLLNSCCSKAYTASNRSSPSSPENKNINQSSLYGQRAARPSHCGTVTQKYKLFNIIIFCGLYYSRSMECKILIKTVGGSGLIWAYLYLRLHIII